MRVLLEGNLAYVSLFNLLQFIKLEQRNVLLHVKAKEVAQEAKVYFEQGAITHASLNRLEGADAMYRLIGWWDYGAFQMIELPAEEFPKENIQTSLDAILMESARYIDEFSSIREHVKNLASGLAFTKKTVQMIDAGQLPEFTKMLPRSFTVARFFEVCPYSHWDSLTFLQELLNHKAVITPEKASAEDLRTTNVLTPIDSLESILMEFIGLEDSRNMMIKVLEDLNFERNQNFGFTQLLTISDRLMEHMRPLLKDDDELQEATYRLRARITSLL